MDISKLVEQYPNDMELGAKVREIYWENRKQYDEIMEKMKDAKIYESPDGGKTIYERPFGASHTERTLVDKSQLSIFPKEVEYTDEYFKPNYK
jgi:hypothetical protein